MGKETSVAECALRALFFRHKEFYRPKQRMVRFHSTRSIWVLSSLQNLLDSWFAEKEGLIFKVNMGIVSCDGEICLGTRPDEAWLVVNLLNGCNLRGTCNYRRRSYRSPTAIIGHWHRERLSFGEKNLDVHRPILSLVHRSVFLASEKRHLRYHLI